jgi:hypothetical protein
MAEAVFLKEPFGPAAILRALPLRTKIEISTVFDFDAVAWCYFSLVFLLLYFQCILIWRDLLAYP